MSALHQALDAFFAERGPLAMRLPGYRPRASQIELAHAVLDALQQKGARLAVEAGTGTGKSLAYLAAALLTERRVVVTTATKALQDQLFLKDVPLALAALGELRGLAVDEGEPAVVLKGRQSYLCKLRFERLSAQPTFAFAGDAREWPSLVRWAAATATGDRAELDLPEPWATWSDLDARRETCVGVRCPHHDACFVTQARRRAEGARVIITNHHLLCADLRLRHATRTSDEGAGFARVIPDADAVLLDEAHALPDVATDHFGVAVSTSALARLVAETRRFADGLGGDQRALVLESALVADEALAALVVALGHQAGERTRLRPQVALAAARDRLAAALVRLGRALAPPDDERAAPADDGGARAAERAGVQARIAEAADELRFTLGRALDDARFVVMIEPERRGVLVSAAPVDVAGVLADTLFHGDTPVVMTSATLAVGGNADAYLRKVGVPPERASARVWSSPFDFARKGALYCPKDMPEAKDAAHVARFVDEARFLLELTRGGALFLFTSHGALKEAALQLRPIAAALALPFLQQGEGAKHKLLDELRRADGERGAVLCATRSFWQGVDVRGRALRLVVIDRLPFDVPTDPLVRARADLCAARGGDPFRDLAVPDAALALKQGAGRLLRDVDDAGVVAVLDGRLRTRAYGRTFLEALPPLTRIGARPALAEFWRRFVQPSLGGGAT
ncbi:MAG: ATP-dependent DNA helicase [Deltaproteobacteria bacterium]|nr:ATP-dependent DNA helicase [Deltaproteobacteria bacterium]